MFPEANESVQSHGAVLAPVFSVSGTEAVPQVSLLLEQCTLAGDGRHHLICRREHLRWAF